MNHKLRLLLLSNTVFVFAGSLFAPLYSIFILNLKGGLELAGALVALQFFSSFLTELFVVRTKDKAHLSNFLLQANFLIRCLVWLSLAVFPTITTFIVCQILNGIADAIGSPSFNTLVSDNLDAKEHIKEWGLWELIKNPAMAIASLLGGFIVTNFGFSSLYLLMSFLAFTSFLVYHQTIKNR